MALPSTGLDAVIRSAAFEHVRQLGQIYPHLTNEELRSGFLFQGERIPFVNPQRGIFKPRQMRFLLSVRTVFPRPGQRVWYDDQTDVHRQIFEGDETIDYAFMGDDPASADNRWLREAMEYQIPIIYFLGIAPGAYHGIEPTFIVGWNPSSLKAQLAFDEPMRAASGFSGRPIPGLAEGAPVRGFADRSILRLSENAPERRYALRAVKQRLHQASFREAVIAAYSGRCALSRLPEQRLLDAAHIIDDQDEGLGQPIVRNGIPLSKIHHAAFDTHLIGIDPDYRLHVSDKLMTQQDGTMLDALKQLNGGKLHLPRREQDWPDRDRLAARFERFRAMS